MIFRSIILSTLLLATTANAEEASVGELPSCPRMTEATLPKFHQKCDRVAQNSQERRRQRIAKHAVLGKTGAYPLIPSQKTVVCPLDPLDLSTGVIGQDTRWIVENKSSGRVVIAFLKNGVEHSAMNPKMSPPQSDAQAILAPGEFKVIHTFEGHVFYVRELLEDGSTGDVLLQHRPGVVELTNRYGQEFDGEDVVDDDVQGVSSMLTSDESIANSSDGESFQSIDLANKDLSSSNNQEQATSTPPQTKIRSPRNKMECCNMVYQGFRNAMGLPLDIYYAGVAEGQPPHTGPMHCAEKFKFHLGTHRADNTVDWKSFLKYEATMVGHVFVARLASNPDIVVDSFTMAPTEIHDCPRRKQQQVVVDQVIEFNGIQHGNANLENTTEQLHLESATIVSASGVYMNIMSS